MGHCDGLERADAVVAGKGIVSLNASMIEVLTAPDMYRAVTGLFGPAVWPRHYSHFSCAFTGTLWTICPIASDADVNATMESGSNFVHQLTPWWRYFETREVLHEPKRPALEMIHAYLVHCMYAPCWTEVYDQWLERNGREPWRLWQLADEHAKTLLEVETPAELAQWIELAVRDGFDFLSPTTEDDRRWITKLVEGKPQ